MKAVAIEWEKNKVKEAVLPSPENVLAGTYNPLSRPLFIYVSRKSLDKPAVKEFVEFYLKNVKTLAAEVKYMPLTDTAYQMAMDRVSSMQTGTGFGGVPEVGLPVEEILKRPPKL
jgi:phosphate transport system substrate-binding protein